MSTHIIFIFLLLIFLLYIDKKKNTEGFTITSDLSTLARENLEASKTRCIDEITEIVGESSDISREDIGEWHRKEILKANILTNMENEKEFDPEVILPILEEIEESQIQQISDPAERESFREILNNQKQEQIQRYGKQLQLFTTKELDRKYQELENVTPSSNFCIPIKLEDLNLCKDYDDNETGCNGLSDQCIYFQDYQKTTILSNLLYYRNKIDELETLENTVSTLEGEKQQLNQEKLNVSNELTSLRNDYRQLLDSLEGETNIEKQNYINQLKENRNELTVLNQWPGWGDYNNANEKFNYLNEMKTGNEQCAVQKEEINRNHVREIERHINNENRINRRLQKIKKELDELKKKKKGKCGGRKKGRHPRHCGGRTVRSKRQCESTYKRYRGRDYKCQWVNSRRSCDFWQPGRPHTRKLC